MTVTTIAEKFEGEGRVYRADVVKPGKDGGPAEVIESRLVRARTQAAARNHAMKNRCGVRVASQDDLVALLSRGTQIENAITEPEPALVAGEGSGSIGNNE